MFAYSLHSSILLSIWSQLEVLLVFVVGDCWGQIIDLLVCNAELYLLKAVSGLACLSFC